MPVKRRRQNVVLWGGPAHAAIALLAAHALRDTAAGAAVAPVGTCAQQTPQPSPSAARGRACFSARGGPHSAGLPWRPSAQTPPPTTSTAVRLLRPAGVPPQRQGCLQGTATHAMPDPGKAARNQLFALCLDTAIDHSIAGRSRTRMWHMQSKQIAVVCLQDPAASCAKAPTRVCPASAPTPILARSCSVRAQTAPPRSLALQGLVWRSTDTQAPKPSC